MMHLPGSAFHSHSRHAGLELGFVNSQGYMKSINYLLLSNVHSLFYLQSSINFLFENKNDLGKSVPHLMVEGVIILGSLSLLDSILIVKLVKRVKQLKVYFKHSLSS